LKIYFFFSHLVWFMSLCFILHCKRLFVTSENTFQWCRFIPCKTFNPFVDGTCDYCFYTDIILYPVISMNVWCFFKNMIWAQYHNTQYHLEDGGISSYLTLLHMHPFNFNSPINWLYIIADILMHDTFQTAYLRICVNHTSHSITQATLYVCRYVCLMYPSGKLKWHDL
jgi:hypothetical protein